MITQKTHSIHPASQTIPTTRDSAKDNVQSSSTANSSSTHSDWKTVGSPPRQAGGMQQAAAAAAPTSVSFAPTTTAAAAATPDHYASMSWLQQDYAFPPVRRNSAVSAASAAAPPWASAVTLPTPSSSISTASGALFDPHHHHPHHHHHHRRSSIASDYPDIASVPMLPEVSTEPYYREYRSMSFSADATNEREHPRFPSASHQHLGTMHEEGEPDMTDGGGGSGSGGGGEEDLLMSAAMDDELLAQAQLRARSKSSAAAFNIWHPSHAEDTRSWMRFTTQRRSSVAHAAPSSAYHHHHPSSATTAPGYGSSIYSPLPAPSSSLLSNGDRERLAGLRRFSLSPMPESRLQQHPLIPTAATAAAAGTPTDPSALAYLGQRRHSLATPLPQSHASSTLSAAAPPSMEGLLEGMQALRTHDTTSLHHQHHQHHHPPPGAAPQPQPHDDLSTQFPPESMGKGRLLSDIGEDALFCVVEFKRGRSDMYFSTMPADAAPARNDFVIVEADRGHDLGKVTLDRISRSQLIAMIKQQQENGGSGGEEANGAAAAAANKKNDVHVKRILRRATSAEIAVLMSKSQDEAKALLVCQSKIKQKQMPMQVVDAEYQWDKRKLTFYFVADRRVDFRELVRDLFKLYKTRIWMCAVSTGPQ